MVLGCPQLLLIYISVGETVFVTFGEATVIASTILTRGIAIIYNINRREIYE
jgi:hypothetical protein